MVGVTWNSRRKLVTLQSKYWDWSCEIRINLFLWTSGGSFLECRHFSLISTIWSRVSSVTDRRTDGLTKSIIATVALHYNSKGRILGCQGCCSTGVPLQPIVRRPTCCREADKLNVLFATILIIVPSTDPATYADRLKLTEFSSLWTSEVV